MSTGWQPFSQDQEIGEHVTKLPEIKDSPVQMHYSPDGHVQLGPCYSVQLPDALPVGTGWSQACPDRSELVACRKKHERVVAAYEVALGHMFQTADLLRTAAKEIDGSKSRQFEIANEIVRVLSEYEQRKREEMKTDITFQNEVAWEHFMMGISESLCIAKQVIDSCNRQPVEVASTGQKEGEQ